MQRLRPDARSLSHLYRPGLARAEIYEEIVEEVLGGVRLGRHVCAAFYGHPGMFSYLGHESVARARREGFTAYMLPAVSAADCLIADLGVDPGQTGSQTYEATSFLVTERTVDVTAALVLWQVSAIGERRALTAPRPEGLRVLAERLLELYPPEHEVTLYEAPSLPVGGPVVRRLPLSDLAEAPLTPLATLYVPPARKPAPRPEALERLGLEPSG